MSPRSFTTTNSLPSRYPAAAPNTAAPSTSHNSTLVSSSDQA